MNTTLDGVISDELSWILPGTDEVWDSFFEMIADVDLLLLGSGMWPDYRDYWTRALIEEGFSDHEVKYAQIAKATKHIIFSRNMKITGWENATIASGDLTSFIQQIKSEKGKSIQIVGGVKFASEMINTGLVDEYRITINPVILGRGKSLYKDLFIHQKLECFNAEHLDSGAVVLSYRKI